MSYPAGPGMRSMMIMGGGGNVVLPRTGSDEPVRSVVRTTGSDEPVDNIAVTSSADTVGIVSTGVAFQEKCDAPCDAVFDYDENPDDFDYDDPGDYDNYPDVYGFIEPDDYELYDDLHGPDDCGIYCISRGECFRAAMSSSPVSDVAPVVPVVLVDSVHVDVVDRGL